MMYACNNTPDGAKPLPVPDGFIWQGHRGCRGILPENSIQGFLKALEFPGVNTLELDLAVSKDHQLIVSHEPWFNHEICRKPDGSPISKEEEESLLLYERTAEEIRDFHFGMFGHPRFPLQQPLVAYKPTLREVVEAVRAKYPNRKVFWNIEIKSDTAWDNIRTPPIDTFSAMVVREVHELGIAETCNIQSFDLRAIQAVHRLDPSISIAILVENVWGVEDNLEKLGFTPQIYSPYNQLVTEGTVDTCHKKGMKIIPWTVNDVVTMRQLIALGVDGIITDFPDKIREVSQ